MSKSVILVVCSFVFTTSYLILKIDITALPLTTGVKHGHGITFEDLGGGPDNPTFQHYNDVNSSVKQ